MRVGSLTVALILGLLCLAPAAGAQEIEIHNGFVFYAGKYTVDEETFGVHDEGNELENLLKEVPAALDAFHSFETWHTTGNVFTGLSLAAFAVGGIFFAPAVKDEKGIPSSAGIIGVAAGGGLLVLGLVFEFISWSRINSAARLYNKDMEIDDGPALRFNPIPLPAVAVTPQGANLALNWRF